MIVIMTEYFRLIFCVALHRKPHNRVSVYFVNWASSSKTIGHRYSSPKTYHQVKLPTCPFITVLAQTTMLLTHWGRVTHICVSDLTINVSDNGLSPGRCQAIIWTNDGTLLIWPLGTNFNEILFQIRDFSFKKMHLKLSSAANFSRPQCVK